MTRPAATTRRSVLSLLLVAVAGCEGVRALTDLQRAMATEFHQQVGINVNGGTVLTVVVPTDANAKMDAESRAELARRMAEFARAHYARGDSLERIGVVFQTVSRRGPVTVTKQDAVFAWSASELATPAPPPPPPAAVRAPAGDSGK